MQIKRMSKEAYPKFIDYVFQTCDVVELKKYSSGHNHQNQRIVNIMLSDLPKNLNISCKKKCIDLLYIKFKNNPFIFDQDYKKSYETNDMGLDSKTFQKLAQKRRKSLIKGRIYHYIYNKETNNFLLKNKSDLIYAREDIHKIGDMGNSYYFFKLSKNIKQEIQNKNSIFAWRFPISLEDICFFNKNGLCWLWSTSHEEMYAICFQEGEEKEYEYLKSIGIEFVEEEFTPTPKEYLFYLEDDLKY